MAFSAYGRVNRVAARKDGVAIHLQKSNVEAADEITIGRHLLGKRLPSARLLLDFRFDRLRAFPIAERR